MSTGARPNGDTDVGQMTAVLTQDLSEHRGVASEVLGLTMTMKIIGHHTNIQKSWFGNEDSYHAL